MKEIEKLFQLTSIKEIEKSLRELIKKIETTDKEQQEELLQEIVSKAKEKMKELEKKYALFDTVFIYPKDISALALLVEEICNDADNNEDILKVLKFNLNNYFSHFEKPEEDDSYVDVEEFKHILIILEQECNFLNVLKNNGIHFSIMILHAKSKRAKMEILNYNSTKNTNFSLHSYYGNSSLLDEDSLFELELEQFGYLLKGIIVGESQKAPDNFLDIFDSIDMPQIDEESKDLTALFANSFAHYIIEKIEQRVVEKLGPDKIKHLESRNEDFVKKLLSYFDNLINNLLKKEEEWDDNEKCPCGSGKPYKKCCKKKKLKYYKGKDKNTYTRAIPIHPDLDPIFKHEKIRFKKIFGRMPGNDDYILGGVLLKDLKREYKLIKRENVINQAWLYASHKTGIMLTEENRDSFPERDIKEFTKYTQEYKRLMKSKIKNKTCNTLKAVEATNFFLESMLSDDIPNMVYVLNLCVNFYSKDSQDKEKFIIHNIKDFLVFCAYKASLHLTVLLELVNNEYYDTAMAEVRIIFEILITMRAYKKDYAFFEKKILSVMGVELGTHRKLENKHIVENIQTGRQYKYDVQKKQLAERAGKNFEALYNTLYSDLSEFLHLDTESATKIFQDKDLFLDIDECLIAGFLGMVLELEIIMELMDFEGSNKKLNNDIKYFSNILLKNFLDIFPTIIAIEDKKVYHILEDTLKEYKTDYKINYQRNNNCEIY